MSIQAKRSLGLLLALIACIFGCMMVAHGIQTDHGAVAVSEGVIETPQGDLTYKLGDMMMDFTVTGPDGTVYTLSELLKQKKAAVAQRRTATQLQASAQALESPRLLPS